MKSLQSEVLFDCKRRCSAFSDSMPSENAECDLDDGMPSEISF